MWKVGPCSLGSGMPSRHQSHLVQNSLRENSCCRTICHPGSPRYQGSIEFPSSLRWTNQAWGKYGAQGMTLQREALVLFVALASGRENLIAHVSCPCAAMFLAWSCLPQPRAIYLRLCLLEKRLGGCVALHIESRYGSVQGFVQGQRLAGGRLQRFQGLCRRGRTAEREKNAIGLGILSR